MTASRSSSSATAEPSNTACPPRRSFVASDARRRGHACLDNAPTMTAFVAALTTPGDCIAGVDSAQPFSVSVDDGDTMSHFTRVRP
jgi:hypothetical protein